MRSQSVIYVAGEQTLIGAAIAQQLERRGYRLLRGAAAEPDLTDGKAVADFFARHKPEYVFMAAGRSGGILANQKYPADLMFDNLLAACNVIHAACRYRAKKLLYLASSCSYPKDCPQPMRVESLLTGPLEPTNEAYAVAKIAGVKLCQAYRQQYGVNFIVGIPANAFGPGDDFDPEDSHVIAALIRRLYEARLSGAPFVEIWGTGTPRREFIYADDLADACLFVMENYDGDEPINLGGGTDVSIGELAELVKEIAGYKGELRFDSGRPDGMPLKSLDSHTLMAMGWRSATPFRVAVTATWDAFVQRQQELAMRA